jgi:hypothetical protein
VVRNRLGTGSCGERASGRSYRWRRGRRGRMGMASMSGQQVVREADPSRLRMRNGIYLIEDGELGLAGRGRDREPARVAQCSPGVRRWRITCRQVSKGCFLPLIPND